MNETPQHPVDALKAIGLPMTPEQEAAMRAIFDEEVIVHRITGEDGEDSGVTMLIKPKCDEEVCGCDCDDGKGSDTQEAQVKAG